MMYKNFKCSVMWFCPLGVQGHWEHCILSIITANSLYCFGAIHNYVRTKEVGNWCLHTLLTLSFPSMVINTVEYYICRYLPYT